MYLFTLAELFTEYNILIIHNPKLPTFNFIFHITQILILILPVKPQIDHVHLSYSFPLQYHQILYATSEIIDRMEAIIQYNYIPLLFKLLSWHPHHHNFPPIPTTFPPTLISKPVITTSRLNSSNSKHL